MWPGDVEHGREFDVGKRMEDGKTGKTMSGGEHGEENLDCG